MGPTMPTTATARTEAATRPSISVSPRRRRLVVDVPNSIAVHPGGVGNDLQGLGLVDPAGGVVGHAGRRHGLAVGDNGDGALEVQRVGGHLRKVGPALARGRGGSDIEDLV